MEKRPDLILLHHGGDEVTWCGRAGGISARRQTGSCWYERDDCARCTPDSSSRPSQRGRERDPCGLNLTERRGAAMLGGGKGRGAADQSGSSCVNVNIWETHWEAGCRCRRWGRSRRCADGSGSGRSAACPGAPVSARRWSSSVVNDRNKRSPCVFVSCLWRNLLLFLQVPCEKNLGRTSHSSAGSVEPELLRGHEAGVGLGCLTDSAPGWGDTTAAEPSITLTHWL